MYSETLLDHFRNPRNVGELPPPALSVSVTQPVCGDILKLWVRFEEDRVAEVRYKTRGCTASIAAGSALTEWMEGKTRAELTTLKPEVLERAVGGIPPESRHALLLCVDAVRALAAL